MRLLVPTSILLLALASMETASAHTVQYTTSLSGLNENPTNDSPGTGTALVTLDLDTLMMRVEANFSDLMGEVTIAHIHCCTDPPMNVGVATPLPTFPGFPAGVTSGTYDMTFDMSMASSYNPAFVDGNGGTVSDALNALVAGLDNGRAYFNIHTSSYGGGEIRGFLEVVPEPSAGLSLLAGMGGIALLRRRRRNGHDH